MYTPPFSPFSYNGDYPDGEEPTCDICGRAQDDSPNILPKMREFEADWNGETGNHALCENPSGARQVGHARKRA